ncbi:MAG: hypothetical protein L6Q29_03570 [Candidatus Pacebacteria bacterium]|nr:hypothetical protein [Candidatus Paceibacterota bacterium]NUQ57486.1 hypothetical protein [Candidatus Paceibacter sp.]
MTKKQFDRQLIKLAEKEIKEWQKFINHIKKGGQYSIALAEKLLAHKK